MNANELADYLDNNVEAMIMSEQQHIDKAATMLRQQDKEIKLLKADVAGWMDTSIGKTPDKNYWLNLFAKKAREK